MQTWKYTNTLSISQSKDFAQGEEQYSKGKKAIWLIDFKRKERRELARASKQQRNPPAGFVCLLTPPT